MFMWLVRYVARYLARERERERIFNSNKILSKQPYILMHRHHNQMN